MSISQIVDVQITRDTRSVSQAGFGTVLVAGTTQSFPERIRYYTDAKGVAEDFALSAPEYLAAAAIFSQTPRPTRIAIGRRSASVAGISTVDFNQDLDVGDSVTLSVNGVPVTGATLAALDTAISAIDGVADVAVDAGNFTLTVTSVLGRSLALSDLAITTTNGLTGTLAVTTPAVTVATGLQDISAENDDWYAVVLTSQTAATQLEAARWLQSKRKLLFVRSAETAVLDATSTTDIAAVLKAGNYSRSVVTFHAPETDDYIDAAWQGKLAPYDPGSVTYAMKTLDAVSADKLTASQEAAATLKNVNTYTVKGGIPITFDGRTASGEFIDIIVGTDWLQARIEERVFSRLANLKKIPFTDAGVAIVENEIRAVLQDGVNRGLLAPSPGFEVNVPLVQNVSPADRAARFLPDITFTATLAGAVHKVQIRGTVSV